MVWSQREDMLLIENFELYKNLINCEEKLASILQDAGFHDKNSFAVRKRIKQLKLTKSLEDAKKVYDELYEIDSVFFILL